MYAPSRSGHWLTAIRRIKRMKSFDASYTYRFKDLNRHKLFVDYLKGHIYISLRNFRTSPPEISCEVPKYKVQGWFESFEKHMTTFLDWLLRWIPDKLRFSIHGIRRLPESFEKHLDQFFSSLHRSTIVGHLNERLVEILPAWNWHFCIIGALVQLVWRFLYSRE